MLASEVESKPLMNLVNRSLLHSCLSLLPGGLLSQSSVSSCRSLGAFSHNVYRNIRNIEVGT